MFTKSNARFLTISAKLAFLKKLNLLEIIVLLVQLSLIDFYDILNHVLNGLKGEKLLPIEIDSIEKYQSNITLIKSKKILISITQGSR